MEEKVINNSSFREIPNVRKIYWIWHDNYLSVEKIKRQEFWRINKLNLKPGITPKLFNLDVTEWKWDESGTKSSNGGTFEKQLVGFVPKLNEWLESYLNEMVNRKMVIFIETFNDSVYLFGGEKCRAQFSFTKSINSRNGYELTFTTLSDESSLIINDEDFFPAAEENPGCEPVLIALNGDELHTAASGAEVQINLKDQDDVTVVPLDIDIVGDEINIILEKSEYNIGLVDRFGNNIGTKQVSSNANWDLRTLTPFDWADIFLSRETSWGVSGFYTNTNAENAIANLVDDLNAAGIWQLLQGFYPLVGGTAAKHKWNLKYPFDNQNSNVLNFFNSPTHNREGIITSAGGFNMRLTTSPSLLQLNESGHFSFYYRSYTPAANTIDLFCQGDSRAVYWHLNDPNAGSGTLRMFWCGSGPQLNPSPALTLTGHWTLNRPNSTNVRQIRNGTLDRNIANTSTGIFFDGTNQYGAFLIAAGQRTISSLTFGQGLTPTQEADLYTAIQTFQTTLGRQL
jgi:hypothetical protein